jgi:hypothetical protein
LFVARKDQVNAREDFLLAQIVFRSSALANDAGRGAAGSLLVLGQWQPVYLIERNQTLRRILRLLLKDVAEPGTGILWRA